MRKIVWLMLLILPVLAGCRKDEPRKTSQRGDARPAATAARPAVTATRSDSDEAFVLSASGGQFTGRLDASRKYLLDLSGTNGAVTIRLKEVFLPGKQPAYPVDPGHRLLAIGLELVNATDTPYSVPRIGEQLHAVVNGRWLATVYPAAKPIPGHIRADRINLPKSGSSEAGLAVFDVPDELIERISVYFLDPMHGNISVPLPGPAGGPPVEAPQPVAGPKKNASIEAAIYNMRTVEQFGQTKAPAGMAFLVIDLRGRSLDVASAAGATGPASHVGVAFHVTDWQERLTAVADNEYAYPVAAERGLGESARFLPDVLTGGEVAFLVPGKADALEIRWDFDDDPGTGPDAMIPLVFTVKSQRVKPVNRSVLAQFSDDDLRVTVNGLALVSEFAGRFPEKGQQLLVVDVTVADVGKIGMWFPALGQLNYLTQGDESVPADDMSFKGPRPAAERVWVPPNQHRAFQLVYQIPVSDSKPRLEYAGASGSKTVTLKMPPPPARPATSRPTTAGD